MASARMSCIHVKWHSVPPILLSGALTVATQTSAEPMQQAALDQIKATAVAICGDFDRAGFQRSAGANVAAEAELKGLVGRLLDLGVEGAGQIESREYANVLQDQLGKELQDNRACRLKIWNDLSAAVTSTPQGMPPSVSSTPQPSSPPRPQADGDQPGVVQPVGATVTAEEFIRLVSSNPSSRVDFNGRIEYPFCTSLGVLRSDPDLRSFLGVDETPISQMGRIVVTSNDIMRVMDYSILGVMGRPDQFGRLNTSNWCKEQQVTFDNDYIVGVIRQHLDVQQAFLFDVIIDWQSGLVKGVIQ